MRKVLFTIGFFFTSCTTSTKLIEPMSVERNSVYIEPNDIMTLAEDMVDNMLESSKLSSIKSYSFEKIQNRSCEDEFETILISNKIKELLSSKTTKKYIPNSNYRFEGKLFQQCPFEDGVRTVSTTLTLELINQKTALPIWSHSISLPVKSQKSSWVLY